MDLILEPDSLDQELTGGESISVSGDFANVADSDLPVALVLEVESDEVSDWNDIMTPAEGELNGEELSLTDDVESREWSFGDGNTASGENVEHTYSEEGVFEVELELSTKGPSTIVSTHSEEVEVEEIEEEETEVEESEETEEEEEESEDTETETETEETDETGEEEVVDESLTGQFVDSATSTRGLIGLAIIGLLALTFVFRERVKQLIPKSANEGSLPGVEFK